MSAFQNMEVECVDTVHAVCPVCRRACRGQGEDPITFDCRYCGRHEYSYGFCIWAFEEWLDRRWPTPAELAPFVARFRECLTWDLQPTNFRAMVRHCSSDLPNFNRAKRLVDRLSQRHHFGPFRFPLDEAKDSALDLMCVCGSSTIEGLAELLQGLVDSDVIVRRATPPGWFCGQLTQHGWNMFHPIVRVIPR